MRRDRVSSCKEVDYPAARVRAVPTFCDENVANALNNLTLRCIFPRLFRV